MMAAGFAAAIAYAMARDGAEPACCAFCRRRRDEVLRFIVHGAAGICSECLGEAVEALRAEVAGEVRAEEKPAAPAPRANGHTPPLMRGDAYTGEMCDFCFNLRMIRTGTCSVCLDCGGSSGCS